MTTIVTYYIPEDREDPEKLNAFIIYKDANSIRLNDIKENFPLPGEYYFRFKFKFNEKNVWIDFNNPDAQLPKFENKVIMKVSRISWEANGPLKESNSNDFPDIF